MRPARSILTRSQVLAKSTVEFYADRCCRTKKLIKCKLEILGVSLRKGGEILLFAIWDAAGTLEFILRSGPSCGLESITLWGPSCALESILRSRVHAALSGPSYALGSILRAWVHPALSSPSCALGSILRARVHPTLSG